MVVVMTEKLPSIKDLESPYPPDVFIGKSEEGKYGRFGHRVFENTKADIGVLINELLIYAFEEKEKTPDDTYWNGFISGLKKLKGEVEK